MSESEGFGSMDLDYKPRLGGKTDYRIGIVGSGGIVRSSHLPAYRMAGLRVTGIWNRTEATARAAAAEFGIPKVFRSWEELVASRQVDVVDISLPPHLHPEVAVAAAKAGKHMMVQKPMAITYGDAVRIIEAARGSGVKLAVNQNGRWDPAIRASRTLIEKGFLGTRLTAFIELRTMQPWQSFWADGEIYSRLMILGMSVHHIDQFRFLFGEPEYVNAITATYPGQKWKGDSIAHYWLQYRDGFFASSLDDGSTWSRDYGIRFRFTGSDGVLKGTIGWPDATYSTLQFTSRGMDGEPSISGEDNLRSLQLVFACYRSAEERRAVRLSEIAESAGP